MSDTKVVSVYDTAIVYQRLGISVIPIRYKSKVAAGKWKVYQNRLPTPEELKNWFYNRRSNLALVMGSISGSIITVDFDETIAYETWRKKYPRLAKTATQRTAKGFHVLFRLAGQRNGNFYLENDSQKAGDIRGEGGYILAYPSIHPSDTVYQWVPGQAPWECEILAIGSLAEAGIYSDPTVRQNGFQIPVYGTASAPYGKAALASELTVLAQTVEGNRNHQLNRSAFALGQLVGGNVLPEDEVKQQLFYTARQIGLDDREIETTIKSGLEAGKKQPRGVPDRQVSPSAAVFNSPESMSVPPVKWNEKHQLLPLSKIKYLLSLSETGDAEMFFYLYEERIAFDQVEGNWYKWNRHYWTKMSEHDLRWLLTRHLTAQYSQTIAVVQDKIVERHREEKDATDLEDLTKALQKRIKSLRTVRYTANIMTWLKGLMPIDNVAWDNQPWILPLNNGYVDLKSGEFHPGRPDLYIRIVCPTEWQGINCAAPRFTRFLEEIHRQYSPVENRNYGGSEIVTYLQRFLGMGLIGEIIDHAMLILDGGADGRNGKDTLLSIIGQVLGPLAGLVPREVAMDQGKRRDAGAASEHLISLRGKRIAWVSETSEGERLDVDQVKALTGTKEMTARALYQHQQQWQATHTLILMSNHKPVIDDPGRAIWERIKIIEYSQRFLPNPNPNRSDEHKADKFLHNRLKKELSGILAWLVRGCLEYQKQGLNPPDEVSLAIQGYRKEQLITDRFAAECLVEGPKLRVNKANLYGLFEEWCANNDIPEGQITKKRMFNRLMSRKYRTVKINGYEHYVGIGELHHGRGDLSQPGVKK